MSVKIIDNEFIIVAGNSMLVLMVNQGYLEQAYYGSLLQDDYFIDVNHNEIASFALYENCGAEKYVYFSKKYEYSGCNSGDFRISSLNLIDSDGDVGCRLKYENYKIVEGLEDDYEFPHIKGLEEGLVITLFDEVRRVRVELYYYPLKDCNVIVRFAKITNVGLDDLILTNVKSLQVDFENANFDVTYYSGIYGDELRLQKHSVEYGKFISSSNYGVTGHNANPFIMLSEKNTTEESGNCYAFNLLYSGNFENIVEKSHNNNIRVTSGINSENFSYSLKSGECFYTPQAIMMFSENGLGDITRTSHYCIRNYIVSNKHLGFIAINTWESFYYNIDEKKFDLFSRKAKEIGADIVVLDDGWFRNSDNGCLGDWNVVLDRFPHGLAAVAESVKRYNVKLGLWFEPEMISQNARLYKEHPEWMLSNGLASSEGRNQYVLDMSNPCVIQYLYGVLDEYISKYNIAYVKWDFNRYLSEVGSAYYKRGCEVAFRFMQGTYRLLNKITKKHPYLLIEHCAGGGGRFDLGMLYYSPCIWVSDNLDPFWRIHTHYDGTYVYPPETLSYHLASGCGVSGIESDMDFRYIISNLSGFGVEFNINLLDDEKLQQLKDLCDRRSRYSKYIETGDLYRLDVDNSKHYAFIQVLPDKSSALLTFIQFNITLRYRSMRIKLKGLDPNKKYRIGDTNLVYYGKTLEKFGLRIYDLISIPHKEPQKNGVYVDNGKNGSGFSLEIKEI